MSSMRAILKKTVSPNFRAGDILKGENDKIKNLVRKNIAVLDSSLLAYWGLWISVISNLFLMSFLVFISLPISHNYIPLKIPFIWGAMLSFLASISIMMNISYFYNIKAPYVTCFLMSLINPIAGIMFLVGNERVSASYNPKTMSISAVMFTTTMVILTFASALLSIIDFNIILFPNIPGFATMIMFPIWTAFLVIGFMGSGAYDIDFMRRRKRFITFLAKQNTKIEYRTKALNAYRAYLNTGNAEKLVKDNVDILSETLHESRIELDKL